jgi:hypothetical protein
MGARDLDPILSIEYTTDPMWYKFPSLSPYNAMGNNPIMFIDPDGRETKHFYDPNETTDNGTLRNTNLIAAAEYFKNNLDNDNAIHIFAHGAEGVMGVYINGITTKIRTPNDFEAFLSENFEMWKNREDGEHITIVLHSCETGKGVEGSFAAKMSKDLENTTVIAPTKTLTIGYSENNFREQVFDKYEKNKMPFYIYREPKNKGFWNVYKNGQKSDYYRWEWESSSVEKNPKSILENCKDFIESLK